MNQSITFNIEIIDLRTKESVNFTDESFVMSIDITRNDSMQNIASVAFANSDAFLQSNISPYLKLFNYVKIDVTVENYDGENTYAPQKLYFSGFIDSVSKGNNFTNQGAFSAIVINIADYTYLLNNTFYSRNLSYLDFLAELNQDFRMLSLFAFLEADKDGKRIDSSLMTKYFTPSEMIVFMFGYFYYRFFDRIFGQDKRIKPFKIFTPFCYDENSLWNYLSSSLVVFKEQQGNAMDILRYFAPGEFFEINVYENEDEVVLIVRPKPYMRSFEKDYYTNLANLSGKSTIPFIIEKPELDFGFKESIYQKASGYTQDDAPVGMIKKWHADLIEKFNESSSTNGQVKLEKVYPNRKSDREIGFDYYQFKRIDVNLITKLDLTKDHGSVLNIIFTNPILEFSVFGMDTRAYALGSMLQRIQGMEDVSKMFGSLQGALDKKETESIKNDIDNKIKNTKASTFENGIKKYISEQFSDDSIKKGVNPIFLMNYGFDTFKNMFVAGDLNLFGIREYEAKINYYGSYCGSGIALFSIYDIEKEKLFTEITGISGSGTFGGSVIDSSILDKESSDFKKIEENILLNPKYKQQKLLIDNLVKKYNQNGTKATNFSDYMKELKSFSEKVLMEICSKLNMVFALSARDNELLYNGSFDIPIDLTIKQCQIFDIVQDNNVLYRGYVNSVSHKIDYSRGMFLTSVGVSRVFDSTESIYNRVV